MVEHIQNVRAIGDGVVHKELQLRRIAQAQLTAQFPAQETGGGLETLQKALFILAVQCAHIHAGIAQVGGGIHMGDGQHGFGDARILNAAQQACQLLLNLAVDTADTVRCHSRIAPFG